MSSVLLVVEYRSGKTKTATLNALTFAQQFAEKRNLKLCLLIIGKEVQNIAESLRPFGVDMIYIVEDKSLENCMAETWGHVIAEVAKQCEAVFIGMNSGTTGRNLAKCARCKSDWRYPKFLRYWWSFFAGRTYDGSHRRGLWGPD